MNKIHKSSSHEQMQAEKVILKRVIEILSDEMKEPVQLTDNISVGLSEDGITFIQPDFYSEECSVVGEIFAHIGKPRKAQDNKIANDILKMLLLEKVKGRKFRKIIAVCDRAEYKKLKGRSALALSIDVFGIEIMMIDIDEKTRERILQAQERQKMTNAE